MAFAFNPFTGNFDLKGSGGGASYIDGEVQNFSALPQTIGSPAVDSAYLVREAEGAWLLARKPAGIYIRTADTGARASDWTYAGEFPDVFSDDKFVLYDETDSSKNLVFQLSSITTGTTRTLTAPDASGHIQVEGQPIGNTTPAAGTFTTLALPIGSAVGSAASPAFRIGAANTGIYISGNQMIFTQGGAERAYFDNTSRFFVSGSGGVSIGATGAPLNFSRSIALNPDALGELHQRSTTQSQAYFLYNTYTSATNHERGFLKWSSNVFQIGTEAGSGGGTVRSVDIRVGTQSNGAVFSASGSGMQLSLRNIATTSTSSLSGITLGSGHDIVLSTTTGTKICTATNQLLGFYNATPVAQPAAVADATDAASTQARLNDLLARLRTLGLIAT
jgi:hypothetical protein